MNAEFNIKDGVLPNPEGSDSVINIPGGVTGGGSSPNGQKLNVKSAVSAKKLSDLAKVELLESTVQKGTMEDLQQVLQAYKPFEMAARALDLAARYRVLSFVKELVSASATFKYPRSPSLQKKYTMN